MVVIALFLNLLFYEHIMDIGIKEINMAVLIATLEISIALAVWIYYNDDKTTKKKYQTTELCRTLNNIRLSIIRLYQIKFNDGKYEESKKIAVILSKNISIFEHQFRITGDALDKRSNRHMLIIDQQLTNDFAYIENITKPKYKSAAKSCNKTTSELINRLGYKVEGDDSIFYEHDIMPRI